jgi:hypothetical protein
VSAIVAHIHTEAIARAETILQQDIRCKFTIGSGLQEFLVDDGDVPFGEIFGGHGELAGGEEPAFAFLGCGARRAEGVTKVAGGVGVAEALLIRVEDTGHGEGLKNFLLEELQEGHAGNFFDDQAGDDEIGVGVLPLGAGIEIERLAGPLVEDLLRGGGLEHVGHDVVLRPIVLIAGGVREELADGDFVGASEMGKEFGDFVVEGELALFLKEEDGGSGELFADGADAVAHRGSGGGAGIEAGVAVGVEVNDAGVFDDGEGGAGDAGFE